MSRDHVCIVQSVVFIGGGGGGANGQDHVCCRIKFI